MDFVYLLNGSAQVTMTLQATNQEQLTKGFVKSFAKKEEKPIKKSATRKIESGDFNLIEAPKTAGISIARFESKNEPNDVLIADNRPRTPSS